MSRLVFAALCAALALPAAAQTIKPGVWEVSNNIDDPSGAAAALQRQFANMPPDQRQMIQQMMAQRGVQLNPTDGGLLAKVCVTPEMAKNSDLPVSQDANCSQSHSPMQGGKMSFSFTCPATRTSGSGEVRYISDSSYTMTAKVMRGGSPAPITVASNARWLGADCGALAPSK